MKCSSIFSVSTGKNGASAWLSCSELFSLIMVQITSVVLQLLSGTYIKSCTGSKYVLLFLLTCSVGEEAFQAALPSFDQVGVSLSIQGQINSLPELFARLNNSFHM